MFQLQNVDKKNIYFYKHDIYFNKLMFIFKNINLELKLALRAKYWFLQTLLYNSKLQNTRKELYNIACTAELTK